jgi:hypothetical protein
VRGVNNTRSTDIAHCRLSVHGGLLHSFISHCCVSQQSKRGQQQGCVMWCSSADMLEDPERIHQDDVYSDVAT